MNKQEYRAKWMSEYERELTTLRPEMAGKVDWDTATYYFTTGRIAKQAAQHFASVNKVPE